jgi:hypothetical protein
MGNMLNGTVVAQGFCDPGALFSFFLKHPPYQKRNALFGFNGIFFQEILNAACGLFWLTQSAPGLSSRKRKNRRYPLPE